MVKILVFISNRETKADEKPAIKQPLNKHVKRDHSHNNDKENPDYSAGI